MHKSVVKKDPPRSFFFHYNKPASKKLNKPQITLHYKNQCILLDNLECMVPTKGRLRKTQPYFVISGKASEVIIKNKIAVIK